MTTSRPPVMPTPRPETANEWRELLSSGADGVPVEGVALEQLIDLQRTRSRQVEDTQ